MIPLMPRTRFVLALLVLLVIVLTAVGLHLRSMLVYGFSARDRPTALEASVARSMRRLAVPRGARTQRNPVPATPETLAEARAHFADHCAICHGNDGRGQTPIGRNLYPKAPDMSGDETQSLSDGEIFYVIRNGVRLTGMPAWGGDTPEDDEESWKLVHFIRHLPGITPEEIRDMESMNPVSRRELDEKQEIEKFLRGEEAPPPSPHKY